MLLNVITNTMRLVLGLNIIRSTLHTSCRFLGAAGLLVYHEKVKSSRVYLRDSSLVSAYPVLLFGGSIDVQHQEQLVSVDDWLKFKVS